MCMNNLAYVELYKYPWEYGTHLPILTQTRITNIRNLHMRIISIRRHYDFVLVPCYFPLNTIP